MRAKRICHVAGLLKKLDCKKTCRESSAKGDNHNPLQAPPPFELNGFLPGQDVCFENFYISNFQSPGMSLSTASDSNSHHLITSTTNACYPKHNKITPRSSDRSCRCRPYLGHLNHSRFSVTPWTSHGSGVVGMGQCFGRSLLQRWILRWFVW